MTDFLFALTIGTGVASVILMVIHILAGQDKVNDTPDHRNKKHTEL